MNRSGLPRSRGFSLVELLVTLAVVSIMMVGILGLLDSASKTSKDQTNLTDAQASSRAGMLELARVIRQGRVGQLSFENAIMPYASNAAGTETLTDVNGNPHTLRKGTDAIEVRGVVYGDTYILDALDVTCGGINACTTSSTTMSVRIKQTSALGITNYQGNWPSLNNLTDPFYFVVSFAATQKLTASNFRLYSIPLYIVGLVDPTTFGGTSGSTFTFNMDLSDTGAQLRNALPYDATNAYNLDTPISCGALDDIVFFADRGNADSAGSYLHPFLAQAVYKPGGNNWDIQPVVDDVEDFQVAYGVDGTTGTFDRGVAPAAWSTATANADEWVGNVAGEVEDTTTGLVVTPNPPRIERFVDITYTPSITPPPPQPPAVPALRAVMVGLVVKSHDPDPRYLGSGAYGVQLFDSNANSLSTGVPVASQPSSLTTALRFRRRVQTMAINLRNYL